MKETCRLPSLFVKNMENIATSTQRRAALEALENSLQSVHPCRTVPSAIAQLKDVIGNGSVYVAGLGKAAYTMAEAVLSTLGDRVEAGLVVAPKGFPGRIGPVEVYTSDHPVPTKRSLEAAEKLIEFLEHVPPDSIVLFLVSGGGSSLVEKPCRASIEEVARITRELLYRGAGIHELNTVRSLLSCTKAGGLLGSISAEKVVNLIMSDVVGDNPCYIASGPTIPGCEPGLREAENILKAYGLEDYIELLRQSARTRENLRRRLPRVVTRIVARNIDALQAAGKSLASRGYRVQILTDRMRGEAREVAKLVAGLAEALTPGQALVLGGETSVTVRGRGVCGRNQELCLAALHATISIGSGVEYTILCSSTDGIDGVSPVSGAIVDSETYKKALDRGLDLAEYLHDNNSYGFFKEIGDFIDTGGYTGINVNDILLLLRGMSQG